ncbi:MAG: hypothetical protein QM655_04325 [Nocardioidaceae bacterium]
MAASLGVRWFLRPQGDNQGLRWRRVLAVAVVLWALLVAAALWQANLDRHARGLGQLPDPGARGDRTFAAYTTDVPYRGDVMTTVFVGAARQQALPPPGVARFPAAGEVYVSPAVRRAMVSDPAFSARIPGRIAGVIGASGLQSPDQYFMVIGATPGEHWRRAHGWGNPALSVTRPSVPNGPLLGLVACLVGIPALLVVRATGRMSAQSRQRSLAVCHLIGVPSRALRRAAGLDAALCAMAGAVLGTVLAIGTVLLVAPTRWLGIAWYPPSSILSIPIVLIAMASVIVAVAMDASRRTGELLESPLASSAKEPTPLRVWRVVPLVVGVCALAGVVAGRVVLGVMPPDQYTVWYMLGGGALASVGAVTGLPAVFAWVSARLRHRSTGSSARLVALRRLSWQRDSIALSVLGLVIVSVSTMIAAGVVADLAALSPIGRHGDAYAVEGLSRPELDTAASVPAYARYVEISDGTRTNYVAECAQLERLVGLEGPGLASQFAAQCRPNQRFVVAATGQASAHRMVLHGLGNSTPFEGTVISSDPATVSLPSGQTDLLVYPGRSDRAVDTYFSQVLAVAPQANATNLSADAYRPMVVPTRRLMLGCGLVGFLLGAVLMLVTTLDARRRSRGDSARLAILGAPRVFAAHVHAATMALGAAVAVGIGLTVGLLCSLVYTMTGGLTTGPGALGWAFAGIATSLAAVVVLASWIGVRFSSAERNLIDEVRVD